MNNEKELSDMRPLIEKTLADLDREISKPVSVVWKCRSLEHLVRHYNQCVESYVKQLAGSSDKVREMFIELIKLCQMEIQEAEAILYSLKGKTI